MPLCANRKMRERNMAKILVIDDEVTILRILPSQIENNMPDCKVIVAQSGEEGIRKAKEIRPFAITLDILMPQKDGWGVLSDLKADPETRDIPIIVLSIIDNQELGFSLGAFDYIVKPVDKDAIIADDAYIGESQITNPTDP